MFHSQAKQRSSAARHFEPLLTSIGTFYNAIKREIFRQQPQTAFRSEKDKHLLRKGFWLYLFYASISLRDAQPAIPDAINGMIKYLVENSDKTAAIPDKTLREIICRAVAKHVSMVELGFPAWDHERDHEQFLAMRCYQHHTPQILLALLAPRLFSTDGSINPHYLLGAAAAIEDIPLLLEILRRDKEPLSLRNYPIFGDIILNSFVFGRSEVLAAFSDWIDGLSWSECYLVIEDVARYPLRTMLEENLKTKNDVWLKLLLKFIGECARHGSDQSYALKRFNRLFTDMLNFAVEHCDSAAVVNFLDAASGLKDDNYFHLKIGEFEQICRRHDEHVVVRVAELLSPDAEYIWRNHTTLTSAVNYGNEAIVAALIDAGADVNRSAAKLNVSLVKIREIVRPIDEAIKRGNADIVKVLLERGAKADDVELGHRSASVYNLLREAKMKETGKIFPTHDEHLQAIKEQRAVIKKRKAAAQAIEEQKQPLGRSRKHPFGRSNGRRQSLKSDGILQPRAIFSLNPLPLLPATTTHRDLGICRLLHLSWHPFVIHRPLCLTIILWATTLYSLIRATMPRHRPHNNTHHGLVLI